MIFFYQMHGSHVALAAGEHWVPIPLSGLSFSKIFDGVCVRSYANEL